MTRLKFDRASILSLLALVAALSVSPAAATRTFNCEKVWSNASSDNTATDCFTNTDHLREVLLSSDHVGYTILAVVPLLLLIIFGLICPFICCGRYCCNCCGGGSCCGSIACIWISSNSKRS